MELQTMTHKIMVFAIITIAILIEMTSNVVRAQDGLDSNISEAMDAFGQGQTLRAIRLLESQPEAKEMIRDLLGSLYSFVGDWEKAKELRPTAARKYKTSLPQAYQLQPALEAILNESRGRQVVIINEAHDAPEHRAFITQLVEILKRDGFSHYAAETLSDDDTSLLKQRGYPKRSTGFYTNEPQFGELVRAALKCDLTPIGYEAEGEEGSGSVIDGINAREESQCKNIVDRILSKHPQARVLIHVGLDHVMEEPKQTQGKEVLWLAARLKKVTGIDPLTIDQITQLESSPKEHTQPAVARDAHGNPFVGGPYKGYVDFQVYHPPVQSDKGRPTWLVHDSDRRAVEIPDQIKTSSEQLPTCL
jgi:hypothetical protein